MDALSVAYEVALDRLKTDTSALGAFTRQHAGAGDPSDPDLDLGPDGATSTLAETHWRLPSAGKQGALAAARKTRAGEPAKQWALTQASWAGTRREGAFVTRDKQRRGAKEDI